MMLSENQKIPCFHAGDVTLPRQPAPKLLKHSSFDFCGISGRIPSRDTRQQGCVLALPAVKNRDRRIPLSSTDALDCANQRVAPGNLTACGYRLALAFH